MPDPIKIDPEAWYDENAACLGLGMNSATLKQGRRSEGLRWVRKGNRNLYLGKWLVDWLSGESEPQARPSPAVEARELD